MAKYRIHSGLVFFETQTVKWLYTVVRETTQLILSQFYVVNMALPKITSKLLDNLLKTQPKLLPKNLTF